jgi:hypothetical protein
VVAAGAGLNLQRSFRPFILAGKHRGKVQPLLYFAVHDVQYLHANDFAEQAELFWRRQRWGGPEGRHNIFDMNNSLLGGSSRPLLD